MTNCSLRKLFPLLVSMLMLVGGVLSTSAQNLSGKDYYNKGMSYFFGDNGCAKDYSVAVENFKLAEQAGCYDGDLFYGFCMINGQGTPKNVAEGVKRYARASSRGDRQALYYFGSCLEKGEGVKRDSEAAKRYFAESAKKGEKRAAEKLRDAYGIDDYSALQIDWHNSERFLPGMTSGKDYYRKGYNYFFGKDGCNKDYALAAENFKLAEQSGCYDGDVYYGFCMMTGKGTSKNIIEGAKRYARASSRGEGQAMYYFADCLEKGLGVARNTDAAKRYLAESAKLGEKRAIAWLHDTYGIDDYSGLQIDWHNTERFLINKDNNNVNADTKKTPQFTWLSYQERVDKSDYTFKVGVKSASRIVNSSVYVNGALARGINAVANDGYDYVFNPTVKLTPGENVVRVCVETSAGSFVSEKQVNYKAGDVYKNTGDKRIALVVGNSAYQDPSHRLPNPVNDANDVAEKLSALGFRVIKVTDQSQRALERSIADFSNAARGYDVALFFYAGHGVSTRGVNYMIPTDADLPSEDAVRYKCVDVNMVLDAMESAGCAMKIMVLDACRNNPFARSWYRSAATNGLSTMNAPKGTFISFSTAPGEVASDGLSSERNSPFTSAFLNTLSKPGLGINDVFQDVLDQVYLKTNERQSPWISSSFRGKFIFNKQ